MEHFKFLIFVALFLFCDSTPQLENRIIGGKVVNITEFPYQVSVQHNGIHMCGGSIASPTSIITAAHCVFKIRRNLSVRAGSSLHYKGGLLIPICSILIHPSYDDETKDYDIAIVKLCTPLQFSYTVLPIALPNENEEIKDKTMCTVTGWGLKTENGNSSYRLRAVNIPKTSDKLCSKYYKGYPITKNMFCAGLTRGGKDACQGDSGGPLRANGKLFGVVSWGYGCARPYYPGVYTNIIIIRKWIKRAINL